MPFGQSRAVVNSVNSDERGWEVGFETRICKQSVSVTVGAVLCNFCRWMGCRVGVLVCIRESLFLDGSAQEVVYE